MTIFVGYDFFRFTRTRFFCLLFLFLCSFFIRALIFYNYLSRDDRFWQVDSPTYHLLACSLSEGKGYQNPDGSPNVYRLPGYSLFLASYYYWSDKGTLSDRKNVLWIQVFLSSFIPVLIFYLAQALFPGALTVAWIAAWWGAFHEGLVLYAGFFMTETLFIFFFLLFLLFFVRLLFLLSQKVFYEASLAGFFLGLASLVRPVGHYLIVLACFIVFLFSFFSRFKKNYCFQRGMVSGVLLFFSWLITIAPWLMRNYLLYGALFFHTLPGGHFLYLSAARVFMLANNCSYQEARNQLHQEASERMLNAAQEKKAPLSPYDACLINEQLARAYFCRYPLITARLWATDILRAALSLYSAELLYLENNRKNVDYFEREHTVKRMFMRYLCPATDLWWLRLLIYLEILFFLLLLIGYAGFCITALLLYWRTRSSELLIRAFMATVFILFFLVIALAGGYARMRLPTEALLIICASWYWYSSLKSRLCLCL